MYIIHSELIFMYVVRVGLHVYSQLPQYHLLKDFFLPLKCLGTLVNNQLTGASLWLSGKEFTCRCRRHGFNPWSRKLPHAAEQLCLCTSTIEPVLQSPEATSTEPTHRSYWSPHTWSLCTPTREATAMRSPCIAARGKPLLGATREKPPQQQRPSTVENKLKFF